ncbi:MAG: carbamoyltransferase C-terminal domain-containing protein, partial [Deltaproteobacteria bacterium]
GLDGYPSLLGANHNAAAALAIDGRIVAACEEERLTRVKFDGRFPRRAIAYCLKRAGLRGLDAVDLFCTSYSLPALFQQEIIERAAPGFDRVERAAISTFLRGMRAYNRIAGYDDARSLRVFERETGVRLEPRRFRVIPHHVCHVASAFYDAPFDRALCVTLDGQGETDCGLVARMAGTDLEILSRTLVPNSLGYLYLFTTLLLGFQTHDEYRVMGLAPYGRRETYRSFFRSIIRLETDGRYVIDPKLMAQLMATQLGFKGRLFPPRWRDGLGPQRRPGEPLEQRHMDIAAGLQEALEETVMHVLAHQRAVTGERNLCLAGGVALNSTLNGVIARSGLFDRLWVHPAAHDAGAAVGAALYGSYNVLCAPRTHVASHPCGLGPEYTDGDIDAACREACVRAERHGTDDLARVVAAALAEGEVVGWFQGRSEWGPRALGHRSILADPRRADMKERVNRAVKHRESFRPFAPSCLAERADEWFDLRGLPDSPHMLFVVPVREAKRGLVPAVTHVDGSARVQTVTAVQDPRFHALLKAFETLTGVPLLMNTSFNVQGEPIVESPSDALRCFLGTGIGVLVLGDVLVRKHDRPSENALDDGRA